MLQWVKSLLVFLVPNPIAQPFHEAWSQTQTQRYIKSALKKSKKPFDDFAKPDKETMDLYQGLNDAVLAHVLHLAKLGRLVHPANTEGLELDFVHAWGQVIAGQEDRYQTLGHCFAPALRALVWKANAESEAADVHAQLVAMMDKGDFGFQDTELNPCQATGMRIKLATRGWKPFLGLFTPNVGWSLVKEGQFTPPGIEHIVLPLPSGELLIHDQLNVGDFPEALEAIPGYDQLPSLGTAVGRVLRAKAMCMHLGVGSVWVGDVGPDIVPQDGRLLMGFVGEEGPDPKLQEERMKQSVGSIHQGTWSTTLIDKQVLIDVLARNVDRSEAQAQVEDYVSVYKVLTVHVPSGEHHLYFAADPDVFKKKFASQEVDFEGFKQPMMVLSPTPLTLVEPTPKAGRKPGM